jgi:ADP-heptose:LPS heptosyltransferase
MSTRALATSASGKPKLLVVELWGLGDLMLATPLLQAASEKFAVSLVAKPYAVDLKERFWPEVSVIPFIAPWTAFRHKYRLHAWPWREIFRLRRQLRSAGYQAALSARWDPRDHVLLWLTGAPLRLGFPRLHSQVLLTHPQSRPDVTLHRYESWRVIGSVLGLQLPERQQVRLRPAPVNGSILVHSGAAQPVRVWSLDRYREIVLRLRQRHYDVQVACDPDQKQWWLEKGESAVATPRTVSELLRLLDKTSVFVGNDSGPAHLAALCGAVTFTIFGPQLPEWFIPMHPAGDFVEGKPCPFKPCSDYCQFPVPRCMENLGVADVWSRLEPFLKRVVPGVAA